MEAPDSEVSACMCEASQMPDEEIDAADEIDADE
jgi:hypothetical protein